MCHARRVNDQFHCDRCGYQWDVMDQDAPTCRSEHDVAIEHIREILNGAPHHELADVKLPIIVKGHIAHNGEVWVRCNRLYRTEQDDLFYIFKSEEVENEENRASNSTRY